MNAIAAFLSPPSDLPLLLVAKTMPLAIVGYWKAWLVLKELHKSGKIEIVPYPGV